MGICADLTPSLVNSAFEKYPVAFVNHPSSSSVVFGACTTGAGPAIRPIPASSNFLSKISTFLRQISFSSSRFCNLSATSSLLFISLFLLRRASNSIRLPATENRKNSEMKAAPLSIALLSDRGRMWGTARFFFFIGGVAWIASESEEFE